MANKNDERFWQKWLETYKANKCLWDPTDETRPEDRLVAWSELIQMAKTVNQDADAIYLRNCLKNFIYKYKFERKKVEVAKANGILYEPQKAFYYKVFKSINKTRQAEVESKAVPDIVLTQEKLLWYNILKKYVSFKCLWDHKKQYTQMERLKAWLLLLKMVKQVQPEANLKFLKKRISAYRANYLREINKIRRKAETTGGEYTSQLFYMSILEPIYQNEGESANDSNEETQPSIEVSSDESSVEDDMLAEVSGNVHKKRDLAKCTRDIGLWRKVIKKYVALDCLWNTQRVYKRKERADAWQALLKFVQISYRTAHIEYIRSRISSLRAAFEKEHEKILAAKNMGVDLPPDIFYYNLMRPMYEPVDHHVKEEYSSDETTNDSKPDLNNFDVNTGRDHPKYSALREELESLGYICGPFTTENLTSEQKAWLIVIKKYVTFKCLWDPERDNYKNIERDVAWHELLGMVKETINTEAGLTFLKHRVNIFRANYLRMFKKAKEEKEQGLEPIVTLWYFNAISPIYQAGFPIILNENEDLQPEPTLNPSFSTYFPDDEKDAVKTKIKAQQHVSPRKANTFIQPISSSVEEPQCTAEADFHEIITDVVEISKEELVEEESYDDDQIFLEMQYSQAAVESHITSETEEINVTEEETHSISNEPYEHLSETENVKPVFEMSIKQTSRPKRERSQSVENGRKENVENCQFSKSDKFQTFEAKIADHLDEMQGDQYLFAEKLISDVCVYGRLKKLTIESGFQLKNA